MKKYPLRISVMYFLLASVWIFVSDWSLQKLNPVTITYLQSLKGFLFVTVTSVGIYFITCRGYNRMASQGLDYKRLFDESPHPILVYDFETLKVVAANHVFFEKYGYSPQETMNLKATDLCVPEEQLAALDFIKRIANRGSSDSGIWRSMSKSGTVFYISVTSYASTFKGRRVRMIILTDVDEEMKAKQALLTSEKKLKSLIDNSSDAIFIINKELNIVTGNSAFEALYHQTSQNKGELHFPINIQHLPDSIEAASWSGYAQRALKGESVQVEEKYNLVSGREVYYDVVLNPMYDVNNEIIGVGCFSRNVTHLKTIELQLSRQLSQLREIAWIQSHELRRPLANIMGLISLLELDVDKPEQMKESLQLLQQSCDELDNIVKDIVAKSYQVDK
jgi:PAS domain S-box-containing protein